MAGASLSVVIVAHDSLRDLQRTLPALTAQLQLGDELVVVDNASSDGLASELAELAPNARLVSTGANVGFAAGANAGARAARGELLVLLNPDVLVESGWAEAIRAPCDGGWAAWMGLVTMEDGREINTSGGVLHFSGLGWAGQVGEPVAAAPRQPVEVGFLSGACLAVPLRTWRELDGFAENFFMYCEDVDLSLRLRLIGGALGLCPDAVGRHRYEFDKGLYKWRLLERNRYKTIVRAYPAAVLGAVAPALLAIELGIWAVAIRGGWARMKWLATLDVLRAMPALLRQRRRIQATATISAAEFARPLVSALDSPYFGAVGRLPLLQSGLQRYWSSVLALLARRSHHSAERLGPD
jgi:GT2 family glycosyltransferase